MWKVKQTVGRRLRRCCATRSKLKTLFSGPSSDRPRRLAAANNSRPGGALPSHMALSHASVHCRSSPYCCCKVLLLSLRLCPWPFPGLVAKPASLAQHNCNTYTTRPFPMPHPRWERDPEPEALTQLTTSQAQPFQMLRVQ